MAVTEFHLTAPPEFRGLDPHLPLHTYQRHLPHWRQEGATYFVTFRLADSLAQPQREFLCRLRSEWEHGHPEPRSDDDWTSFARAYTNHVERWLDEGYGACHFRDPKWTDDLRDRLHHRDGEHYELTCWAIMPNHCHLVIRPFSGHRLETIVGAVKGVSSRNLNASLGTAGQLWEEECYDRIVRDEEHLWRVVQYIGRNPMKAGLAHEADSRRWIKSEWIAAGWDFVDG